MITESTLVNEDAQRDTPAAATPDETLARRALMSAEFEIAHADLAVPNAPLGLGQ
jgi:hypothetical protein